MCMYHGLIAKYFRIRKKQYQVSLDVEMHGSAIIAIGPLILKTFSAISTHMMNIGGKFY